MKIINVGKDELSDYDLQRVNNNKPADISVKRLYYWYINYCYEGSGTAVYQDNRGNWHTDELGHCSCNGPFEGGFNNIPYTRQQVIGLLQKALYKEDNQVLIDALSKLRS